MSINEIMHGFWFYHPEYGNVQVEDFDNDFGDEPCVVVYSESIPHKDGYKYGYHGVGLDELYPLPLTSEILEKNGELSLGIQKGCQNVKCEFVHELQMAMRFCHIDREIIV